MRLYSWNINGFRAILKKGFTTWLAGCRADVVGLQETKIQPEQIETEQWDQCGYEHLWSSSQGRKGYSGVACLYNRPPLSTALELPDPRYNEEGRLIMLEYPKFYFFNVYFPNGGLGPHRLEYKLGYYEAFLERAEELRKNKPIVVCGDFNTAHQEIDLKNPKENQNNTGFLPIERAWLDRLVAHGYLDTFRMFTQDNGHYTWWDYRTRSRERNAGWRIDYFFVSSELGQAVKRAWIEPEVMGSDHCPIGLELADL